MKIMKFEFKVKLMKGGMSRNSLEENDKTEDPKSPAPLDFEPPHFKPKVIPQLYYLVITDIGP